MLSNSEKEELDYFYNWEYSHKTDISNRINLEKNRDNVEKFASVDQITSKLNNLRFAHQIVFEHNSQVFFDAINYTFRAISEKTVDIKIFAFLMNTAYVVSVKQVMNQIMTREETFLLLNMTNFCTSYFNDMERMKTTLYNLIEKDFSSVTILSYLKLILKFNSNSNEVFLNVINLAMILSMSCELTKHSIGCQALSIVSWIARHIDIDPDMKKKLSVLPPIPTLFFSPSRVNVFSQFLKISHKQINECCRDMQEFYVKYYTRLCNRKLVDHHKKNFPPQILRSAPLSDVILEESENESESNSYHARQLGYTIKPIRRLPQTTSRVNDGNGIRTKSKNRLRNIRKYRSIPQQ